MSSVLSVYGSLTFPPGAIARWQASPLVVSDEPCGDGIFDRGNDLGSVSEVIADADDCWTFVRFIVEGDVLHVRAALGDDYWSIWCGRLAALASAAASLGARGALEAEDDGSYCGRLVVGERGAVYEPATRRQSDGSDHAGRADMYRIWAEVMEAEQAAWAQARKTAAAKRVATAGKKKQAKKQVKKAATKAAVAKKAATAKKAAVAKKQATKAAAKKKVGKAAAKKKVGKAAAKKKVGKAAKKNTVGKAAKKKVEKAAAKKVGKVAKAVGKKVAAPAVKRHA
jgi:hypothetical protein